MSKPPAIKQITREELEKWFVDFSKSASMDVAKSFYEDMNGCELRKNEDGKSFNVYPVKY